jgi:hypothetical protein
MQNTAKLLGRILVNFKIILNFENDQLINGQENTDLGTSFTLYVKGGRVRNYCKIKAQT